MRLLEIESAYFCEVAVEPAEENPRNVAVTEIADGHGPDVAASHYSFPGHKGISRLFRRIWRIICNRKSGLDGRKFCGRHSRVFRRIVASCEKPDCPGEKSDDGAHPERRTPAVMNHEIGDQRGERPAPAPTPAKIQPLAIPRSRMGIQRATN